MIQLEEGNTRHFLTRWVFSPWWKMESDLAVLTGVCVHVCVWKMVMLAVGRGPLLRVQIEDLCSEGGEQLLWIAVNPVGFNICQYQCQPHYYIHTVQHINTCTRNKAVALHGNVRSHASISALKSWRAVTTKHELLSYEVYEINIKVLQRGRYTLLLWNIRDDT